MSIIKKAMASIGIGSARVDAILDNSRVRAGEEVKGVIHIKGGNVPQEIDFIYVYVMTRYEKEINDHKTIQNAVIQKETIKLSLTIGENEEKEIPFSFILSNKTPISVGRTPIWISTGLDIKMAVDPTDSDTLEVLPDPCMEVILNSLDEMGFRLRKVKNESAYKYGVPFIQNFEYLPSREFYGYLDEIELAFFIEHDQVELLMEVDRRARGIGGLFEEALDIDERKIKVRFSKSECDQGIDYVKGKLKNIISQYAK